jgi:amino acid adenylation domain-containing protein
MPGSSDLRKFPHFEMSSVAGVDDGAQFLRTLRGLGVELRAQDGKLLLTAPAGVVTPAMQDELRRRKTDLLLLLSAEDASGEERCSPLTFAQQRLWLIDRFAPETIAYNIPQSWTIESDVDVEIFRRALDQLAERHAALRTRIEVRHGEPVQVVMKQVQIPLQWTDLVTEPVGDAQAGHLGDEAKEDQVKAWLVREGREPFALDRAPLIRFHIFRLAPKRSLVSYEVHHIIADQWSLGVLKRDLAALYGAIAGVGTIGLPALTSQYADVAEKERSVETARLHLDQLAYWRTRLEGMPTLLELPFSKARPVEQTYSGATLALVIESGVTQKLRQLAARSQTTLYLLMLSVFAALLYRYTDQDDLCVGTPMTGRKSRGEEDVIGLFVNMLPLRCAVQPAESFSELLKRLSRSVPIDFEHGDIPFQKLVMELHPQRSPAFSPLFQVMFALNPKGSDGDSEQEETFIGVSKFDLTLQVTERAETLEAYFEYRTDLFERADMEQFGRHFRRLLGSIVDAPDVELRALGMLTPEDAEAFTRWNATELDFDRGATLIDLFKAQAEAHPDAVALCWGNSSYTYRDLSERADVIAAALRSYGAGPGSFVALCLDRSVDLIASMLAVFKCGAAYLPLDPKYPAERLAFMLADSRARLLITGRGVVSEELAGSSPELTVLFVEEMRASVGADEVDALPRANAEDAAYLIYTSGSTGKPKGVVVEHRNAVALIAWARQFFDHESLRGMLASTSVCFDLSIFEIFLPLAIGTTIILVNDVLELARSPLADKVTLVNTVPSAMHALLQVGLSQSVRTVCMAGEFLPTELVDRVYAAGVKHVFDLYGPSETTTYSTCVLRQRGGSATIGKPIANTRIYLLDEAGSQVPPGALGEIWIAGEGVARGYLNRPELTAERFVRLPAIEPEGRLYRTGDMARQLADGSLVFLGRRDQQVKLRGYRIELGEVEATLRDVSGVSQLAVVVQGDALVAFLQEDNGRSIDVRGLQEELRKRLPTYMVPSAILAVSHMPVTPNGKIDRKALSARRSELIRARTRFDEAPRDLLEQWLVNIWAYRLGVSSVARDAHFFEELGGHSLAAFEIFAEIEARLGVAMMLATLFQAPTVALLAVAIRRLAWREAKYIDLLMADDTDAIAGCVVYMAKPGSEAHVAALRGEGGRLMSLDTRLLATGSESMDAKSLATCVAEIAAIEATKPALVLALPNSDCGVAERLRVGLSAAGFASVSIRLF